MIPETETRIERRIVLEIAAEHVPAVAELIEEHAAAVEACRMAAGAFAGVRFNIEADPLAAGAQASRSDLERAISAVRGIADRYA